MKFIEQVKQHVGWLIAGGVLAVMTPALAVALGVTLGQALVLALYAVIIFCVIGVFLMLYRGVRNEVYWRKNH